MSSIYEWIKNIAFYLVLVTAIINCVSNNVYKKYIAFFSGLILIIIVISPLSNLMNEDEWIEHFYEIADFKQDYNNFKIDMERVEYMQKESILEAYNEQIKLQISSIVENQGLKTADIILKTDDDKDSDNYCMPEEITIYASYNLSDYDMNSLGSGVVTKEEVNIRNSLIQMYQIKKENIKIHIN